MVTIKKTAKFLQLEIKTIQYLTMTPFIMLSHQSNHQNLVPQKPNTLMFLLIWLSFSYDHCVKIYGWISGADPGIFIRGGGGSNFRKILTSKKKNNNKKKGEEKMEEKFFKGRVVVALSLLQKYGLNRFPDNHLHTSLFSVEGVFCCTIAGPSLHKHTDDIVVLIL